MNQEAKAKIRELIDETGHVLSVDDLEDVNRINEAAEKVAGIDDPEIWNILDRPVVVANIALYPLTIGAHLWMIDMCARSEKERPSMWNCVVAFAMVNSHHPDKLRAISACNHPWMRLFFWSLTVKATGRQLERAFPKVLPGYDTDPQDGESKPLLTGKPLESIYGGLIAMLTKEHGATPQYWLWEESIEGLVGYVNEIIDRSNQEAQAIEKAAHKNGHSKPAGNPARYVAIKEMRECVNALRKKWLTIK